MRHALVGVHGDLGYFVPESKRQAAFEVEFELPVGLRDLVQAAGVPHVEVGRLTVNGDPADWSLVIDEGACVEVHPRFPLTEPPADPRFLLDAHLGKLASYLRLVGLDAEHDPAEDDPALVQRSNTEQRILLTRDRGLLMHGSLLCGSYVRSIRPLGQAVEVVQRFALGGVLEPFSRCMVCNHLLADAAPGDVVGRVPDSVAEDYAEFRLCTGCGRVYWQGSHHRRLQRIVRTIVQGE